MKAYIHNRNTRALFEISLVLLLSRGRPKNATCEQMIILDHRHHYELPHHLRDYGIQDMRKLLN